MISEEFAVLDRAGRLQLPKANVAALGLKDRVRLRLEDDHVEIWPDRLTAPPRARPIARPTDAPAEPTRSTRGDAARRRSCGRSTSSRDYPSGDTVVHALRGVSLGADPGELVAVRGRSGSGKTTLLNILGGLDQPTSGRVLIDGQEVIGDERGRARRRPAPLGRVHLPGVRARADPVGRRERRDAAAARPGGVARSATRACASCSSSSGSAVGRSIGPHELSGGEQQRVAIARALANRPRILLADEPTGQLDSETGHVIMLLLRDVVRTEGVTAIVATHDPVMLDVADRIVELRDGELFEQPGRFPAT